MKIKEVNSYVLQYDLDEELGYSQQYYAKRTAHIVEVITDEGIKGYGEAFGGFFRASRDLGLRFIQSRFQRLSLRVAFAA